MIRLQGLVLSALSILTAACGSTKRYEPTYVGPLAAVADSLFRDRPVMQCRGGDRDECWTRSGDTTRYFYATPAKMVTAVGREVVLRDAGSLTARFNDESSTLSRMFGDPKVCSHSSPKYVQHDLRWPSGNDHILLLAIIPAADLHVPPTIVKAYVRGAPDCSVRPSIPQSL